MSTRRPLVPKRVLFKHEIVSTDAQTVTCVACTRARGTRVVAWGGWRGGALGGQCGGAPFLFVQGEGDASPRGPGRGCAGGKVYGLAFTHDGLRLVSVGKNSQSMLVWDVAKGILIRKIPTHSCWCTRIATATSPGARQWVLAGASNGTGVLWDVEETAPVHVLRHSSKSGVHGTAFSPDARLCATGGANTAKVWSCNTGDLLHEMKYAYGHHRIDDLAFSPDGDLLAASSPLYVFVWRVADASRVALLNCHTPGLGLLWGRGGERIVTCYSSCSLRVWNVVDGTAPCTVLNDRCCAVDLCADPETGTYITCARDGTVTEWQASGDMLMHYRRPFLVIARCRERVMEDVQAATAAPELATLRRACHVAAVAHLVWSLL